jgi:hypothetical protein
MRASHAPVTARQQAGHHPGGAVLDDAEQAAGGGVDQPRHVQGVMLPGRGEPRRLVHPEVGDTGQPGRIIDQRPPMPLDRSHDRVPADAVLAGYLRD